LVQNYISFHGQGNYMQHFTALTHMPNYTSVHGLSCILCMIILIHHVNCHFEFIR